MRFACLCRIAWLALALISSCSYGISLSEDGYHVFPGDIIQDAIEKAALNPTNKVVKVHAGEYRPARKRQALIWFNRAHDGIRLEALGNVTLTAANPEITQPKAAGFPAVVNHVVYFGDGISSNTFLKGFRITGANNYVMSKMTTQMEPDATLPKNLFFYTDGGAIKIFGRSYPTIQNVEVIDNYASPCGAGISVQHLGFTQNSVLIENCVFRRNRAQVTGAAVDLLEGSAARIVNCLFVGNQSNTGADIVAKRSGEAPFTNCGALTIFFDSKAEVRNCTFTGNRNAVDDMGGRSIYSNCIFSDNNLTGGLKEAKRYELDLQKGGKVTGCIIRGRLLDPLKAVSKKENQLNPPSPLFDPNYVPMAAEYTDAGYRPRTAMK